MKHILASLCAYLFVKLIHHVSASVVPCVFCVFEVHGVIAFDYDILVAISSFQETLCPFQRLLPLFDLLCSAWLFMDLGHRGRALRTWQTCLLNRLVIQFLQILLSSLSR